MKSHLLTLAVAAAVVIPWSLRAQDPGLATRPAAIADTSAIVLAASDSLPRPGSSGVDTTVTYSASDSIAFSVPSRMMDLHGSGELHYRTMGLKAERMDITGTRQH